MTTKRKRDIVWDKVLDWKLPMLVSGVIICSLLFSCSARSTENEIYAGYGDLSNVDVDDRTCLVYNLYHESRGESDMANIMILNTVFNRVKSPYYPNTPCEVIKQPKQYSWLSDGKSDHLRNNSQVIRLTRIVDDYTLNKELFLRLSEGVDHYHENKITPEWSLSDRMVKIAIIDNHTFYVRK